MKLMVEYQLGDYLQDIYAIDDGNVKKISSAPLSLLSENLVNLYKEMNSEELILRGIQTYCEQIADEARALSSMRYGLDNINITIIE